MNSLVPGGLLNTNVVVVVLVILTSQSTKSKVDADSYTCALQNCLPMLCVTTIVVADVSPICSVYLTAELREESSVPKKVCNLRGVTILKSSVPVSVSD